MADSTRTSSEPTRLLRAPEVSEITGMARSTIWRLERDGNFPARRKITPRLVGWLSDEIEEWLRSRPAVES